jgi:hypothetical protein
MTRNFFQIPSFFLQRNLHHFFNFRSFTSLPNSTHHPFTITKVKIFNIFIAIHMNTFLFARALLCNRNHSNNIKSNALRKAQKARKEFHFVFAIFLFFSFRLIVTLRNSLFIFISSWNTFGLKDSSKNHRKSLSFA